MILAAIAHNKQRKLNVAVIGASGGIGSALVECLAGGNDIETIYALSRTEPKELMKQGNVKWLPLDLENETSISNAAVTIGEAGELDIVIIASGVLHDQMASPEKDWKQIDAKAMAHVFAINSIGPALVMKHFAPLLSKSGQSVLAAISARVGSISDNRLGGWYSYRASKAALNQIIRTFSVELSRKNKHAIVLGLHPGTVATYLSEPYQASSHERFSPRQSAEFLLSVINQSQPEMSGNVYDWKGDPVPE